MSLTLPSRAGPIRRTTAPPVARSWPVVVVIVVASRKPLEAGLRDRLVLFFFFVFCCVGRQQFCGNAPRCSGNRLPSEPQAGGHGEKRQRGPPEGPSRRRAGWFESMWDQRVERHGLLPGEAASGGFNEPRGDVPPISIDLSPQLPEPVGNRRVASGLFGKAERLAGKDQRCPE
jgi:hypothetical protein